jgi:flagellar motor switch protein FliM
MALIEVQTTGEVKKIQAAARPVTRTDAAICAPFIDRFFEAACSQLEEASSKIEMETYRFGDMVEDARALALALDSPDYDVFRLSVDLGDGAKTGLMTVILPKAQHIEQDMRKGVLARSSSEVSGLGDVIRNAPVTLNAVLDRLEMPLKDACKLEVGMCFPISRGALSDAQLTSTGGHVAARVMLGQVNGFRAARLLSGRNGPLLQDGGGEEPGSRIESHHSQHIPEAKADGHPSLHPSDHADAGPYEARATPRESSNGALDDSQAGVDSGLAEV